MLGIILIIYIGNKFYKLADDYNENKWLYAIISVVVYYLGTFIAGLLIGIFNGLFEGMLNFGKIELMFIALIFGILASVLFHYFLEKKWKKNKDEEIDSINQIGKREED